MSCCLSAASTLIYSHQMCSSSWCLWVITLVSCALELTGMMGVGPGLLGTMNGVADRVGGTVGDTVSTR